MDIHDTFLRVRGMVKMNDTIIPTSPKTIEQVPWLLTVFNMLEKVKILLPMMNIRKSNCAVPKTSRPIGPIKTSPASAML